MLAYSGRGHFTASRVDLSELVADTRQLLQVSITKKCVLSCDLARGLPPVDVDQGQIRQVLVNLVINASDAIGERSGTIRVSTGLTRLESAAPPPVHYSAELPPGDYVFLEVEDNGVGMKPDVSARIFEPFFTTKFAGARPRPAGRPRHRSGPPRAIGFQSMPGRGSRFGSCCLPPAARPATGRTPSRAEPCRFPVAARSSSWTTRRRSAASRRGSWKAPGSKSSWPRTAGRRWRYSGVVRGISPRSCST